MATANRIIAGDVFNALTALTDQTVGNTRMNFQCQCGTVKNIYLYHVKRGMTTSCGCLRMEFSKRVNRTHGETAGGGKRSTEYIIWVLMRRRCLNGSSAAYKWYGGRGIKLCERWGEFKNFLADMGRRPAGTSLDRIDNNGNYEPRNCRWATKKEQMRNTRGNRIATINGEAKCVVEWSEISGIPQSQIAKRLRRGWAAEDAVLRPLRKRPI